ncbi:MAG: helix-turn-helix domain-containing protein [Desulfobacterales bacterium]|nr:helix-turn-helix domain-containing protein [Desulfobacterales bacterium]
MMPDMATAKEVAQYLRLTESTIYKLASTGELPGFKIGKSWRFDMDEILKLIKDAKEETMQKRPATRRSRETYHTRDKQDSSLRRRRDKRNDSR